MYEEELSDDEILETIVPRKVSKIAPERKEIKGIHSEAHALAYEVSQYCNEPKKFAMYLGAIKRMGIQRAYLIFAELKQSTKVTNPAGLFFWKSRQKISTVANNQTA